MNDARYLVAANLVYGKQLIAAAVIFLQDTEEPEFSYTLRGRPRRAHLYRRGDRVPPSLDAALSDHVRSSAVSWALVTAHLQCPPEAALELAVIRAMERWVCREDILPNLIQTELVLPLRKPLPSLPRNFKQLTNVRDWHTAAARALCRYRASQEQGSHVFR